MRVLFIAAVLVGYCSTLQADEKPKGKIASEKSASGKMNVENDQRYEPLTANVVEVLRKSVAHAPVARHGFSDSASAVTWLVEMSRRLRDRIPDDEARINLTCPL